MVNTHRGEGDGERSKLAGLGPALPTYQLPGRRGPVLLKGKRACLYRRKSGLKKDPTGKMDDEAT